MGAQTSTLKAQPHVMLACAPEWVSSFFSSSSRWRDQFSPCLSFFIFVPRSHIFLPLERFKKKLLVILRLVLHDPPFELQLLHTKKCGTRHVSTKTETRHPKYRDLKENNRNGFSHALTRETSQMLDDVKQKKI